MPLPRGAYCARWPWRVACVPALCASGVSMIEAKYILELCDLFQDYLMPLDIHILRQRYNGKTLKSTYTVAKEMGISDETVRTIENRALEALTHCLHLQANDQRIEPMRLAKAIKQPVASLI